MNRLQIINLLHVFIISPTLFYFGKNGEILASKYSDLIKYVAAGIGGYHGYKYATSKNYPLRWIYLVHILLATILFYVGYKKGNIDSRVFVIFMIAGIIAFIYHARQFVISKKNEVPNLY